MNFTRYRNFYFVIRKVDLHCVHIISLSQVHLQPLSRFLRCRAPPGLYIFIRSFFRPLSLLIRGSGHCLLIAQQIPLRFSPGILLLALFQTHGPVTVPLVAEQIPFLVQSCLPDAYSALKGVLHADTHRCCVPEIPCFILHGGAMSCSRHETARIERIGIAF